MRKFQILIVSKSVNNVYKLLQLLDEFVIQTPTGASPLDPLGDFRPLDFLCYSRQMKIFGAATGTKNRMQQVTCLLSLYIAVEMRTTPIIALPVGLRPLPVHNKQEAMLSCYRTEINDQWAKHTVADILPQMKSDKTISQNIFDKNQ